jgi:hypothetical protein
MQIQTLSLSGGLYKNVIDCYYLSVHREQTALIYRDENEYNAKKQTERKGVNDPIIEGNKISHKINLTEEIY